MDGQGIAKTLLDAPICGDEVFDLVDKFVSNRRYVGSSPPIILVYTRFPSQVKKYMINSIFYMKIKTISISDIFDPSYKEFARTLSDIGNLLTTDKLFFPK